VHDRATIVGLLAGVLGHGSIPWPALSEEDGLRLYAAAREEGVHLMVAHRLWEHGRLDECPAGLRDRLTTALRQQLASEEIVRQELQRVLATIAGAGVQTVLMKGAALAYTLYPSPALRPRVDTDILIDAAARRASDEALARLGYERFELTSGDLVMHQASFARSDAGGLRHVIDLHWEASNPRVFTRALPPRELLSAGVVVPQLGEAARALSQVHSLAVACVHRLAHHGDDDRLIWVFDIHLLVEQLTEAERTAFVEFATSHRIAAVCRQGLVAAAERFGGEGARHLNARLARRADASTPEPSGIFATRAMREIDVLRSDLAALQGWRPRLALVREHLFPPATYMRARYGIRSPLLLPFSYVWRILRGGAGWLWPRAITPRHDE
jgi:hypothetical protein